MKGLNYEEDLLTQVDSVPHVADLALWNKAYEKGDLLVRLMEADDYSAGRMLQPPRDSATSTLTKVTKLADYGFQVSPETTSLSYIKGALDGLGVCSTLSGKGGNNYMQNWTSTPGQFYNMYNPKDGVIIAQENSSPAAHLPAGTTLPELRHWSDVAFLQWLESCADYKDRCGKSAASIKYVIREDIINPQTTRLIHKAFERQKKSLKRWPGVGFSASSVEGKALLGSPNGAGVGFLLAQHKSQLGHKTVESIRVFGYENKLESFTLEFIDMLFVLKDVKGAEDVDNMDQSKKSKRSIVLRLRTVDFMC
jgi:hypothetical protein